MAPPQRTVVVRALRRTAQSIQKTFSGRRGLCKGGRQKTYSNPLGKWFSSPPVRGERGARNRVFLRREACSGVLHGGLGHVPRLVGVVHEPRLPLDLLSSDLGFLSLRVRLHRGLPHEAVLSQVVQIALLSLDLLLSDSLSHGWHHRGDYGGNISSHRRSATDNGKGYPAYPVQRRGDLPLPTVYYRVKLQARRTVDLGTRQTPHVSITSNGQS